jgi:RNA polymerase sigma-70 factor (ECF subfamily)
MSHADTVKHDFSKAQDLRLCLAAVLPSLQARARRLTRSRADAEDLVQESVLRALRFESTFQRGTNLRAWMHQILESVFITRCRSRVRERRALDRFVSDPTLCSHSSPSPRLSCVSDSMHSALQALPEKFLKVVQLVDLDELSYREAAERLEVPVGTVMSRLFRARRMLGASMTEAPVHAAAEPAALQAA